MFKKSMSVSEINEKDMLNLIITVEKDLINLATGKEYRSDSRIRFFLREIDILILPNGKKFDKDDYLIYIDNHIFGKNFIDYRENSKNNIKSQIEVIKNKAKEMYNIVTNTDKCINVSLYKRADHLPLELCYIQEDKALVLATSQSLQLPALTFKDSSFYRIMEDRDDINRSFISPVDMFSQQKLDISRIVKIVHFCTGGSIDEANRNLAINILSSLWGNGENNFIVGGLFDFYAHVDAGHNSDHIFNVLEEAFKISNIFIHFNTQEEALKHYLTIGLAALAHDMFSFTDRSSHHSLAREYLLDLSKVKGFKNAYNFIYPVNINPLTNEAESDIQYWADCFKYFTKEMLIDAANMVSQHRASYTGEFTNIGCEIFSAADRGKPDVLEVVKRIYTCALDTNCVFEVDKKGFENHIAFINNKVYNSQVIIDKLTESDKWTSQQIKTFYHLWEKYSRDGYAFKKLKENGVYLNYYKLEIRSFWDLIDEIIVNPSLMLEMLNLKGNINDK